jgi:hypothetical protein
MVGTKFVTLVGDDDDDLRSELRVTGGIRYLP